MESWLNRGAGFDSRSTESKSLHRNREKVDFETDVQHSSHSSNKQRNPDWKQDEFLSTFSFDKRPRASSPDNQEINWSESSSDNDDGGKVEVKKERTEGDKHETVYQESCRIKKRTSQRRRKHIKVKKNVCELPLSKKVSFMSNLKHGESFNIEKSEHFHHDSAAESRFQGNPNAVSLLQNSSDFLLSPLAEKLARNENESVHVKMENISGKCSFNKWTSSTFDSLIPSSSVQEKKRKTKRHDQETCSDGNVESPQLDIEDCMSSSSDFEGNEEFILDDGDDDDDEEKEEEKDGEENKKDRYCDTGIENKTMNKTSDAVRAMMPKNKQDRNFPEVASLCSPEAYSIKMSESSMSENSQLQIIGGVSTPDSSKSSQKMGASDWASIFQCQASPLRDNQTVALTEDSGKKKRKFASKSLTGQLARLVSREKASVRFWNHSVNAGTVQEKSKKCLKVQITTIVQQFSFLVCKCEILEGQPSSASMCKVLLSRSAVDKLNLISGMRLQIFPPWQRLDDGKDINMLCTNYIQVLPDEDEDVSLAGGHPRPPSTSINPQTIGCPPHDESLRARFAQGHHLHLTWSCPCSRDKSLTVARCPASKSEFKPMSHVPHASTLSPQSFTLHSVTSSAPAWSSPSGHCRTLLESIEKAYQNGDCLPPFSAFVLRVFRVKSSDVDGRASLILLLEDMSGTLALASHSEEDCGVSLVTSTFAALMKTERKQCLCQGLSVQSRVSKEKDPMLFSIISQCWLQRKPNLTSQESLDQESQGFQLKVPSFYYILQQLSSDLPKFDPIDEPPMNIDLSELEQMSQEGLTDRFSTLVILLDLGNILESPKSEQIFVLDPLAVALYSSPHQLITSEDCVNICREKRQHRMSICLLRDVFLQGGVVHCDKYSSVFGQSVWKALGVEEKLDKTAVKSAMTYALRLPPLTFGTLPSGDIYSIEGCISKVDEESSYSWEACSRCGAEITHISNHKRIFCSSCHQHVESTISKIKMTVILSAKQFPKEVTVRLDLNAATIQSILPSEMDEEGYDVEQVLGKNVKAAACVVKSHTSSLITLEQLDITPF